MGALISKNISELNSTMKIYRNIIEAEPNLTDSCKKDLRKEAHDLAEEIMMSDLEGWLKR